MDDMGELLASSGVRPRARSATDLCPPTTTTGPGLGESYSVLHVLREEARTAAKRRYDQGPGRTRSGHEHLAENHPLRRKARKVVSAYVSRFAKDEYDSLLHEAVDKAVAEFELVANAKRQLAAENAWMKNEIQLLQQQVVVQRFSRALEVTTGLSSAFSEDKGNFERADAEDEAWAAQNPDSVLFMTASASFLGQVPEQDGDLPVPPPALIPALPALEFANRSEGKCSDQDCYYPGTDLGSHQNGSSHTFSRHEAGAASSEMTCSDHALSEVTDNDDHPPTPTSVQCPPHGIVRSRAPRATSRRPKHTPIVVGIPIDNLIESASSDADNPSVPFAPSSAQISDLLDSVLGLEQPEQQIALEHNWQKEEPATHSACSAEIPPLTFIPNSA
jgi:hypothetical protein